MLLRSTILRGLAVLGAALFLTGCAQGTPAPQSVPAGGQGQPAAGSTQSAPQVKRGGILVRPAGASSYGTTDPAMGAQSYNVWPIFADYLLRRDQKTWEIKPAVIEKWEFSSDLKTLTLNVRKGVKLHNKPPYNGREVEAKDVIYTLKGITGQLYPHLPTLRFPRRANLEQMVDAVEVDKHTVKVTLSEPSSIFLDGMAEYRSPMVPDGLREAFGGGVDTLSTPDPARFIGSGAFVLKTFTQLTEVVYEANKDYWDIGADGKPKPYLDGVREVFIADRGTEIAAFVAGQLSFQTGSSVTNEDVHFIKSQRPDVLITTYAPDTGVSRVAFNLTRKPFDDVRVRRALSLVIDKARLGREVKGEWEGRPLWRLGSPVAFVFPETLPQEELAKHPLYQGPTPENVAEAKRLLQEAGLANGFEFAMMAGVSAKSKAEAQLMADDWNKAFEGKVKVKLDLVDTAITNERAAKGEFDTQFYGFIHDTTAVAFMKTLFHSKGGRNFSRYADPEVDAMLEEAARELDPVKRKEILRKFQYRVLETLPMIMTHHGELFNILQPYVRNFQVGAASSDRAFYSDVWFDK